VYPKLNISVGGPGNREKYIPSSGLGKAKPNDLYGFWDELAEPLLSLDFLVAPVTLDILLASIPNIPGFACQI
jgi:hypothetical protein